MDWQEHISLFGGFGIVVAAAMVLALVPVLPPGERKGARLPFLLLLLHVGVVVLRMALAGSGTLPAELDRALRVLGLFFLLSSMARSGYLFVLHAVVQRTLGGEVPRILRDLIQAILYGGVAFVTLRAAGVEMASLLTTSAVLTAVVGFALQDTLGNLFSGLAIQAQRPFAVGDWIQFDDNREHIGCVVEINWRAVRVRTLDHYDMYVPNSTLAKAPLRNYSSPSTTVRRRAYVEAAFDAPPEQVIADLLEAVAHVPGILGKPASDAIVVEFNERGVRYEVRYYIDDFHARENIDGQVRERIWYAFQRHGMSIGIPQRHVRMFDLTEERLEHEKEAKIEARDEALKGVDFLGALPDEARHRLAEQAQIRMYAPKELIIAAGDAGSELFIVRRGQVAVEVQSGSRFRQVATLGPGQFFGEMSLMTGAERRADVRALSETEVLVIDKLSLQPLLAAAPELAETISRVLAERQEALSSSAASSEPSIAVAQEVLLLDRIKKFFSLGGRKENGDDDG